KTARLKEPGERRKDHFSKSFVSLLISTPEHRLHSQRPSHSASSCPQGPSKSSKVTNNGSSGSGPNVVATLSGMNACPDIVITNEDTVSQETVIAIRECKCHRRLQSDEIRKECGKATDLTVSSYVIVSYYSVPDRKRRGARGLGLNIEELK